MSRQPRGCQRADRHREHIEAARRRTRDMRRGAGRWTEADEAALRRWRESWGHAAWMLGGPIRVPEGGEP